MEDVKEFVIEETETNNPNAPIPDVATMTDREIAIETLQRLRVFSQALEALGNNPMVAAMFPNMGNG